MIMLVYLFIYWVIATITDGRHETASNIDV